MATHERETGDQSLPGGDDPQRRLADPDEYNQGRRLRQLHNAKESVVEIKDRTVERSTTGNLRRVDRNRLVVEKVIDYIRELLALLEQQGRAEELMGETVGEVFGREVTIGTIISEHGRVSVETQDGQEATQYLPYEASMEAWAICNRYFEDVAGAEFEKGPAQPADNPVDPGNRFAND